MIFLQLKEKIFSQFEYLKSTLEQDLTIYEYDINCNEMPSFEEFDFWTRKERFFGSLFKELDTLTNPSLYWFELENDSFSDEIKNLTNSFREKKKEHRRTIPAKNRNSRSKYLYVGIRKGGYRKKDGLSNI